MYVQWLAFEHARLHAVERWPENPVKEATLAAIASAIGTLRANAPQGELPECYVCRAKRTCVLPITPHARKLPNPSRQAA